jgi:hypothetical protein
MTPTKSGAIATFWWRDQDSRIFWRDATFWWRGAIATFWWRDQDSRIFWRDATFLVARLKREIHALVTRELWVLARMVASSLERGRSTNFEPGRSGWLLSRQKLQQTLQFSLPLQGCVDVSLRLNVPPRHSWYLNLFAAGQQHYSRTSHKLWNVRKPVDRTGARVIAVAVGLRIAVLNVAHLL